MTEISNIINSFIGLMKTFSVADALDVAVMTFIIYSIVKLVRETRAEQLVRGLLILILVWLVATQLNLKMLGTLLNNFFQFTVLALLVVFQPELRRALEQMGRTKLGILESPNKHNKTTKFERVTLKSLRSVCDACSAFSKTGTGALIVFERKTKLGEIIDTGTIINAEVSAQLIGNLFFNKAPLHDGALIIRDTKLLAAGCILPLTKNDNLSSDLGTRHRAAIGVSEISDAFVVIVSEETGIISTCINGVITRNYSRDKLYNSLKYNLIPGYTGNGEEEDEYENEALKDNNNSPLRRTNNNE